MSNVYWHGNDAGGEWRCKHCGRTVGRHPVPDCPWEPDALASLIEEAAERGIGAA